ncbi:MAG: arginine--tRNA ligase [Nitriliruptorales bacterium]
MVRAEQIDPVLADVARRVRVALVAAGLPDTEPSFERPRQPEHGDWATPVALELAREAKQPPRVVAERLVDKLEAPELVGAVEVAGPGFVNFRFSHRYFEDVVRRVMREGEAYGRRTRPSEEVERVNLEFVSANPTGPLHVGAGRWAAAGDSIAALLEADGHDVDREYYLNDTGEQIRRFAESVLRVARGEPLTADHYRGDYVVQIAEEIRSANGEGFFVGAEDEVVERVGEAATSRMVDHIRGLLHRLGVDFDVWFSEHALHSGGEVRATVDALGGAGLTFSQDGAIYLRTSAFGDDKDRVLVRSDGRPTYFAADCAYLRNKRDRAYNRMIYLLGADHHGYVVRLQAAAAALGIPEGSLEIRIGQMVNLLRAGEPVRMSKRAGEFVTLDEVVEEVGVDVTRYHFLRQSLDTSVDFDLADVVRASMDNPVYYVQYAHARIASILRNADESGFDPGSLENAALDMLTEPTEEELLRRLAELPETVAEAAEMRAPHRLARYAENLAGSFHRFYTECRVLGVREDVGGARYWLAVAAKRVLANALALLRVSTPERM